MDLNTVYDFQAATISREHVDLRFSYFTTDEIRAVSVAEITSGAYADRRGGMLESGVHAPAMGPMESDFNKNPICPTCGLDRDCPGHMGRVELAMTVYNPFLFKSLFTLLKCVCLECHRLKAAPQATQRVVEELNLLAAGKIPAKAGKIAKTKSQKSAIEMEINRDVKSYGEIIEDHSRGTRKSRAVEVQQVSAQADVAARLKDIFQEAERVKAMAEHDTKASAAGMSPAALFSESASLEALRDLTGPYLKDMPPRCQHCATKSTAKWRKDGFAKMFVKQGGNETFALPEKVREILRACWKLDSEILGWLVPAMRQHGAEIFFLDTILVPPNRFRPPARAAGQLSMSRQSTLLKEVVEFNQELRAKLMELGLAETPEDKASIRRSMVDFFVHLQNAVNGYMDSTKGGKHAKLALEGIRQLVEKKQGLFRMKMMGKRVNFSARSVISPDPNIETSEIGVPQIIAQELSYPETAGPHNSDVLRDLVLRGAEYPGALEVHIPQTDGSKLVKPLRRTKREQREALAKQLITDLESGRPPMTVFRQLQTGDPLLVNRQPTLHKPGIMAHTAKVLPSEKTIRMHYANCNTYNADFDGDEMNLHAPQDPLGRIEALNIARADKQYLVPTSGKPLRGLIQDHVIAGVMLSKRDTFFGRGDACMLVYAGLRAAVEESEIPTVASSKKSKFRDRPWLKPKVHAHSQKLRVKLDPPSVFKPRALWSGKQVFSMVLKNIIEICRGKEAKPQAPQKPGAKNAGLNFESKSKTPGDIWNAKFDGNKEEASVFFQDTELLRGVLDKSQFGASDFGLVHCVYEMVGSRAVGMLLSSIARLFSTYLQIRGFTCAFADLVLHSKADRDRARLILQSRSTAKEVSEEWLGKHKGKFRPGAAVHELCEAAKEVWQRERAVAAEDLEGMMLSKMKNSWGEVVNAVFPAGTKLPFPRNCFAAMVQTGAKGSKVNQSMVTCCLGQQELEGRAPPLMITRRALPCFAAYDMASRTRGYITDRYLTGIRPQEFFFHCMAGREGLVDTAVKTSRSGYLQRCLVKHLESLKVCYDHSVRDADGSVVQFLYGEDGLDVTQASHLYKFEVLQSNFKMLRALGRDGLEHIRSVGRNIVDQEAAPAYHFAEDAALNGNYQGAQKALKPLLKSNELSDGSKQLIQGSRNRLQEFKHRQEEHGTASGETCILDPIASVLTPAHYFGSTSEAHEAALQKHLKSSKLGKKEAALFADFMRLKFMRCLAHPGEAVGVIAAQSMGEPSTQMTLNTFHLAGHGGANVTLGIPRLRELIQSGGRSNSTPSMRMQVLGDPRSSLGLKEQGQLLARRFRHVNLLECLRSIVVHDQTKLNKHGRLYRYYHIRLEFWPLEELCKHVPHLTPQRLEEYLQKDFARSLKRELKRFTTAVATAVPVVKKAMAEDGIAAGSGGNQGDDGEEVADGDDGKPVEEVPQPREAKRRKRITDDDDEEEDDGGAAQDDDDDAASGMYSNPDSGAGFSDDDSVEEPPAQGALAGDSGAEEPAAKKKADARDIDATSDGFDRMSAQEDEADLEPSTKKRAVASPGDGSTPKSVAVTQGRSQAQATDSIGSEFLNATLEDVPVTVGHLANDTISYVVALSHTDCGQRLLVTEMVQQLCETCTLQDPEAKGIKKVSVRNEKGKVYLEAEGVNLFAFNVMPEGVVDHRKVYTNDVLSILETYGIEAARTAMVNEVKSVFGHYGIEVNHRHLSLIADYMAMGGKIRPFSRAGMESSASPLQQMSYETTMDFMTKACNVANLDTIASPASALVVGAVPPVGTGMVSLLMDLDPPMPGKMKKLEFNWAPK